MDLDEVSEKKSELSENILNLKGDVLFTASLKKFNKPWYEDVTPMINSSIPTLIDGDALLLYAVLQDSHPIISGNQFLHVAYLFERFLELLIQKETTCILVFFNYYELVWEKNFPLRTLRFAIYNHFKNNTTIPTYSFLWYCTEEFRAFKFAEKPRCIITSLAFDVNVKSFNEKLQNRKFLLNLDHAQKLFATGLIHCISNDLPIIDINSIDIGVTLVHAFNLFPKRSAREIYGKMESQLKTVKRSYKKVLPKKIQLSNDMQSITDLIIEAATFYLKKWEDQNRVKFLFLYYAIQFTLPLENRAPPKNLPSEERDIKAMQDFISNWHESLFVVIHSNKKLHNNFDYEHIVDLWQGTLFMCILNLITDCNIENKVQLGPFHIEYESIVANMNMRFPKDNQINPYPIEPILKKRFVDYNKNENVTEIIKISKVDNSLINKFCGNMFEEVFWKNPAEEIDMHLVTRRPTAKIVDGYSHNSFRYNHIYGQNLEGNTTQYDEISYQDPKKISNTTSKNQNKTSKMQLEKIQSENAKKDLEKDKEELNAFKQQMNTDDDITKLIYDLEHISRIIERMSCSKTIIKGSILKLTILKELVSNEYYSEGNQNNYIKDILLLIRSLLMKKDENNKPADISDKGQRYISKLLQQYGFKDIAQRNNLPMDKSYKEKYHYNFIRFQMEHFGSELITEKSEPFDPDINFAPDKWQVEFIKAIRRNESALIVAPTSSGKTFASYYCMKRNLQYSANGIVIYVAPTKALVNQVAAIVTHRFQNARLPDDGTALVGVFTRDYRSNPISSRILITVPECLDILLMSPNHFEWAKKIRYVIFDEVHRLTGIKGLVWERLLLMIRCPFLALSATIGEPNMFYKWLQSIQEYKKQQDKLNNCLRVSYKIRCVIHEERHTDLIKYVYSKAGLQHYHPYCALHPKILLDRQKIPESVTLSPKETIQLYDVLSDCARQSDIPTELQYLNYFKDRTEFGFLTRKSVRDYEKELGKLFFKIYEKDEKVFKTILHKLQAPYQTKNNKDTAFDDGKNLLNHMADNNMLPAIVFSYDRKRVEEFCEYLLRESDPKNVDKSLKEVELDKQQLKIKQNLENKKIENKKGENCLKYDAPVDSSRYPINILSKTDSKFKGADIVDHNDLEFIEKRLYSQYLKYMATEFKDLIVTQLQNGVAYHHAGVHKRLRETTEMLFRIGVVKVVVATGTLAVGVHMPCKSVVVFGDSPFLNSLEFHQMAGRAGRRGFDTEGNVIFLNITKRRQDMLMTDKFPKMLGNYPINISLVVRLLLMVAGPESDKYISREYRSISLSKALTILENSLIFETKPYLKQQVKLFTGFALQLLLTQKIITLKGIPTIWSTIIIHLHYHEPANLVLVYLIRSGALAKLAETTENDVDLQQKLVVVMANIFTKTPIKAGRQLDALPECIHDSIIDYNQEVNFIFNQYFLGVARYSQPPLGDDNTLPLSKVTFKTKKYDFSADCHVSLLHKIRSVCNKREITSAFAALSGNIDNRLHTHQLISNIRHEFYPEIKIIPEHNICKNLNGYALDFYHNGSAVAINKNNQIRHGMDFTLLQDFCLVLKATVLAFDDLQLKGGVNARLLANFRIVRDRYRKLFQNAYHVKE